MCICLYIYIYVYVYGNEQTLKQLEEVSIGKNDLKSNLVELGPGISFLDIYTKVSLASTLMHHRLERQNLFSHSSGGQRSEITVAAGLASLSLPRTVDSHLVSLPSRGPSTVCLPPSFSSCKGSIPVGLGPTLMTSF